MLLNVKWIHLFLIRFLFTNTICLMKWSTNSNTVIGIQIVTRELLRDWLKSVVPPMATGLFNLADPFKFHRWNSVPPLLNTIRYLYITAGVTRFGRFYYISWLDNIIPTCCCCCCCCYCSSILIIQLHWSQQLLQYTQTCTIYLKNIYIFNRSHCFAINQSRLTDRLANVTAALLRLVDTLLYAYVTSL